MNRKTILICITAVVILFAAVAVAVFFLYSGTDQDSHAYDLNDSMYGCYQAIPSDAVAVMHFDRFGTFLDSFAGESPTLDIIENDGFRKFLDAAASGEASLSWIRDDIIRATRQYAKRQMTFFRSFSSCRFFHPSDTDGILSYLTEQGICLDHLRADE